MQNLKKFKCPYCPKEYDKKESLNDHVFANHWKAARQAKK